MTDSYARVKPLGTCPHASCARGDKTCQRLAAGNACLKTHFATHRDWEAFMAARFDDLARFRSVLGKLSEDEKWDHDGMWRALYQRIDDRRTDKLRVH